MKGHRTLGLLLAGAAAVSAQTFNFLPGAIYPAGSGTLSAAVGDFNGDGKPDIAIGNAASNSISIYLSNGDGSFSAGATVSVPTCLVAFVGAGDFNHDGYIDLLAVCEFQTVVSVLPGTGRGTFGQPISTSLPQIAYVGLSPGNSQNVAIADFNNDGIPDLLIGLSGTNLKEDSFSVTVMLSNGDGTFQVPTPIIPPLTFAPSNSVVGDFNRDGNLDIAVAGVTGSEIPEVEIFLGLGDGTFQSPRSFPLELAAVLGSTVVADVNRDGIPDLIFEGTQLNSATGEIFVFLGAGDGTFNQSFNALETSGDVTVGLLAADLRGTGTPDLVEAIGDFEEAARGDASFTLVVRAGNGDGTFQNPVAIPFPAGLEPLSYGMLAGDWNGDSAIDLAFAALPAGTVFANTSTGVPLQNGIDALQDLPAGDLVVILNGNTPALALAVSKTQLQFSCVAGGAAPAAQAVKIFNAGTGALSWTVTANSPWLSVSPASGAGTASLTVSVVPGGLSPSTYTGTVQVTAAGATGSPQTITVTFTIGASSNQPVITGVVNGASFLPGFESGSWVTVQGSNLSNTNPGRTWTSSEIIDGNLPTSLDGTSVTIDGKPAFVYYISPTQLNVQAPTDSATGSVPVVVTNNGQPSAPFSAQLAAAAPAFFLYPGTSYAIAQHYPDYADVGNPNLISYTVAAHPGDVLILWATGFGATNPSTPAGVEVTGAPTVATAPTITVGGVPVSVINAVLSPGSAGLYQIAIQLPASVPLGAVTIQASVGGAISPAGISIYVSSQ
jgi:uncharacterized protein (TIGR03437 family)